MFGYAGKAVHYGYSARENVNPDVTFRQEEHFHYLTGHTEPGAALLIRPEHPAAEGPKEILFLPPRGERIERYVGARADPLDPQTAIRLTVECVRPVADLGLELARAARVFPGVYTLLPTGRSEGEDAHFERCASWIRSVLPLSTIENARLLLVGMRQVKSQCEIDRLRKAVTHGVAALERGIRAIRPDRYEYEIAAVMESSFKEAGATRPGYPTMVSSGPNSVIRHPLPNRRRMELGDLVLMNLSVEYEGYASDLARTAPVGGRFGARQREVYQWVLAAADAALDAVRPGRMLEAGADPTGVSVADVAGSLLRERARNDRGEPFPSHYYMGIGHHVGLAAHEDLAPPRRLEPDMVLTVGAAIHIPEEGFGIRIEDNVLTTATGAIVLSGELARAVEEVERLTGKDD